MSKNFKILSLLSAIVISVGCTNTQTTQPNSLPSPTVSTPSNSNASPTDTPSNPSLGSGLINATFDSSVKETNCALETSLRADLGNMFSVNFENKTNMKLKVYTITSSGTRDFKQDITPGSKYRRQNGITNQPWVITDENGSCLKIFTGVVSGESFITLN